MFSREANLPPTFKEHHSIKELTYAGLSDGQYWRSVILALLVISLVIAGIASAIFSYGFVDELLKQEGKALHLDDILNITSLFPQRLPSAWISATGFVYQDDDGHLTLYNATTNKITILIRNHTLSQINVKDYQCSRDMKYILLKSNINQIFKNAYTAHITNYTVGNQHQTKLAVNRSDGIGLEMQDADWAGNTNNVIFVKDNDIYLKYEHSYENVRITFDGKADYIFNGVPDWLYQGKCESLVAVTGAGRWRSEEIFLNSKRAFWSSADGSLLLYASFNDTAVPSLEFPWIEEGQPRHDPSVVQTTRSVRYPMPGTNIPEVKLWLVNITRANTIHSPIEISRPSLFQDEDYYLASAAWVNDSNTRFSIVWMNRVHNFSYVSYCEAPSWTCNENHVERAPVNMWLEVQHHPVFAPDGQSYMLLSPVQENGQQYFTQIKHVTLENQHIRIITYGRHDALQILAWDTVNRVVYYLVAESTGQQHLYAANDQTASDAARPETKCITCNVKRHYTQFNCTRTGTHFNAYFPPPSANESVNYYVIECGDQPLPVAGLHFAKNHTFRRFVYTEKTRLQVFNEYALPKSQFESIPLKKGYTARAHLMMPPSWRSELRDAFFPVIVQVDGRPNSQLVSQRWQTNWGLYMAAKKGVIYIKLDVRGARGQSSPDLYRRLGEVEVNDQIDVIQKLLDSHKYLDRNRIGVWGWGYGGYLATMLMNAQYKVFKCGIAVAPISDWRYYNAAFTEKILGLKSASNEGYMRSDLKTKTNFVVTDSLYIIQGLADLSVPYQHGVMLANALTRSNKLFKHQVYANEGHELVNVLYHMYRSMENHFTRCHVLEEDESPS